VADAPTRGCGHRETAPTDTSVVTTATEVQTTVKCHCGYVLSYGTQPRRPSDRD
jgi:hypothetical protein